MKVTDEMVNRFLSWKLPADFSPDGGVSFSKTVGTMDGQRDSKELGPAWWPVGTNLLNAQQARAMLEHALGDVLAEAAKSERRAIVFGDIVHTQVIAMRAAVVAWKREDATAGMKWIANTLDGPGHLPDEVDIAMGAQPLFDKESAEHEAFRAAHPAP